MNLNGKSGDLIVINIVLLSILFVYTLFAIIQFRYLFASGINLPYGLTHTYYARRGFFELLFLSGINILIILLIMQLIKKHSGPWVNFTKVLLCYLCVITFILLASSFYRMWLYNLDGGLTRLRFLVFGFLFFEAIGLVFTFIYIIKPKFNVILVYLSLGLIYYLLLNVVPMDAIIAKDQIDRHYATGQGDLEYALSLSADAAPQIARLLHSDNMYIKANVNFYFKLHTVGNTAPSPNWQSFNWSTEKCRRIFELTAAAPYKATQPGAIKPANTTLPTAAPEEAAPAATDVTAAKIPPNVKIYAAGMHSGEEQNWRIDTGQPATLAMVSVNSPTDPVVLLLGGQQPTIWYVGWYQDSAIMAVITSGKYTQKVIGLPADVPVVHYNPVIDDFESKLFHMANLLEVDGADQISRQFFGRNVDRAFKMVNGRVLIGEAVPPGLRPITYAKLRKDDFQEPGRPLARYAGIEEAISRGWLRKAEKSDIQEYLTLEVCKMDLPEHIINGKLHGGDGWGSYNTYVVLSPDFAIPPGFDGAYQVNFILPEGIPRPAGDLGRGLIMSFDEVRTRTAPDPQVTGIDAKLDFLSDTPAVCGFPDLQLPPAFKVYAAGNYFGRKLNTVTSTNGPDYLMEITVNSPTEPVVLFLGSSCRAIWHLSWTKDTEIAAVFVSGDKKQDIIGLPENVPVKINDESRQNGCPWFAVNPRIYNLVTINTLSRLFFGKDLDGVFFAEDGRAVVGEPLAENALIESAQILNLD